MKIQNFKKIYRETKKCALSFNGGGDPGKPCKNYCKFYNFNATTAVMEGYTVYFNDVISLFSTFLKYEGF